MSHLMFLPANLCLQLIKLYFSDLKDTDPLEESLRLPLNLNVSPNSLFEVIKQMIEKEED